MERKNWVKPNGEVNQSKLADESKVDQKSISNYLKALKPGNKLELDDLPSPSLVNLAKMAGALGMQPWELLHPDIDRAVREQYLYRRIESEFRKLPKLDIEEPLEAANAEPYDWQALGDRRKPEPSEPGHFGGVVLKGGNNQSNATKPKNKKQ